MILLSRNALRYACCLVLLVAPLARGHEFWIEPTRFEIDSGGNIVANLKVGQYFKGSPRSFLPPNFVEFIVVDAAGRRAVSSRMGDVPAVNESTGRTGLHVLAYQSTPATTTYQQLSKFEAFARAEGQAWAVDRHRARGLPERDIVEAYTRYAKSLIGVGDAAGGDASLGMPFELVAETDPYADAVEDVSVRLLWGGDAVGDAQITVFQKLSGCGATRRRLVTDSEGRVHIPRAEGGRFLVNAVRVTEPGEQAIKRYRAMWESHWVSLTYALPEDRGLADLSLCTVDTGDDER